MHASASFALFSMTAAAMPMSAPCKCSSRLSGPPTCSWDSQSGQARAPCPHRQRRGETRPACARRLQSTPQHLRPLVGTPRHPTAGLRAQCTSAVAKRVPPYTAAEESASPRTPLPRRNAFLIPTPPPRINACPTRTPLLRRSVSQSYTAAEEEQHVPHSYTAAAETRVACSDDA